MTLQSFFGGLYAVTDTYIIPVLIFLCVITFLFNVIRYFILQSGSEEGREKARRYLVWGLIGFVLIVALWGFVTLLLTTLGVASHTGIVCPDYDPTCTP